MPPRLPPRAILNLLLLGFTLRFLGLERFGLWLDEGATWSWATKPTWGETLLAEANHPPLWWLITRAWTALFGDSEAMLRLPAALCGVATVWLAWRLGLRLLAPEHAPRRGGFLSDPDDGRGAHMATWFTGFIAVSAFLIEISQEARMYALLVAESLGLALLYLRWLDRADRASLAGYALVATLALHTHYFAIWPLAALGLHAAWLAWRTRGAKDADERVRLGPFLLANVVAAALFVPWLLYLLSHYRGMASQSYDPFEHLLVMTWHVGVGPGLAVMDAERMARPVSEFLVEERATIAVTALLWFPAPLLGLWALRRRPGTASLTLCALVVPLLGALALLPWFTLVHERYLVYVAPWLWLLAVVGAFSARRALRAALLASLVVVSAVGLAAYHGVSGAMHGAGEGPLLGGFPTPTEVVVPQEDPTAFLHHRHPFGKEPWREAADLVHAYAGPRDLVLLYPGYIGLVWSHYGRARAGGPLDTLGLPGDLPDVERLIAEHEQALAGRKRIFLVVSHAPSASPEEAYRRLYQVIGAAWLRAGAKGMTAVAPIPFRRSWGVHVAIFDRT